MKKKIRYRLWVLPLAGAALLVSAYLLGTSLRHYTRDDLIRVDLPNGESALFSYGQLEEAYQKIDTLRKEVALAKRRARTPAGSDTVAGSLFFPEKAAEDSGVSGPAGKTLLNLLPADLLQRLTMDQIKRRANEWSDILGLDAQQQEALEEIFARGLIASLRSLRTLLTDPSSFLLEDNKDFVAVFEDLRDELNEEQFAKLMNYQKEAAELSTRNLVEWEVLHLNQKLSLDTEQTQKIQEILLEKSRQDLLSVDPNGGIPMEVLTKVTIRQTALDSETQGELQQVLSPEQYSLFSEYYDERSQLLYGALLLLPQIVMGAR